MHGRPGVQGLCEGSQRASTYEEGLGWYATVPPNPNLGATVDRGVTNNHTRSWKTGATVSSPARSACPRCNTGSPAMTLTGLVLRLTRGVGSHRFTGGAAKGWMDWPGSGPQAAAADSRCPTPPSTSWPACHVLVDFNVQQALLRQKRLVFSGTSCISTDHLVGISGDRFGP